MIPRMSLGCSEWERDLSSFRRQTLASDGSIGYPAVGGGDRGEAGWEERERKLQGGEGGGEGRTQEAQLKYTVSSTR